MAISAAVAVPAPSSSKPQPNCAIYRLGLNEEQGRCWCSLPSALSYTGRQATTSWMRKTR